MCAVVSLTTNRIYETNHTITKASTTKLSSNVEPTRVNTRQILIYQCKYLQLDMFAKKSLVSHHPTCSFIT